MMSRGHIQPRLSDYKGTRKTKNSETPLNRSNFDNKKRTVISDVDDKLCAFEQL